MQSAQLRQLFLDKFKENGHHIDFSGPLVPESDPTLLFTNAGMVPYKNFFTGQVIPPFKKVASAQKCLRAGGKHNDLDNVGYTFRHHTFFEMLGNFSFGSYFKKEAIAFAWDFLTKTLKINPQYLCVTYHTSDPETRTLWQEIAQLPEEKIIEIDTDDNFWSMGNTGPCGPCSEIFYDHGPALKGNPPGHPDGEGDRYVEIWNLVFMQFEKQEDGSLKKLPKPCIDTGMGFERICAVMQGTHDNFETDLFKPLCEASAKLTKTDVNGAFKNSHRIIADHLRAASFLIAEGVLPDKEGRGYVLRRILRRAMRHIHLTGAEDCVMHKLVPTLIAVMGGHFKELSRAKELIEDTLLDEESRFKLLLSRGLKLLADETAHLNENAKLDGDVAFKLYDTYGFPLDLTQEALKDKKIFVDEDSFYEKMAAQKSRARAAWSGSGDQSTNANLLKILQPLSATNFIGYSKLEATEKPILILDDTYSPTQTLKKNSDGYIVFKSTPFYAEGGGQVADIGVVMEAQTTVATVSDVQNIDGYYLHQVKTTSDLEGGNLLGLKVDLEHRKAVQANHTATHLLHTVLRQMFGESVVQKGSLVTAKKLRFDFTLRSTLTPEDQDTLEQDVNTFIRANIASKVQEQTIDEAFAEGALGLFGEKYDEKVRVITFAANPTAESLPNSTEKPLQKQTHLSKELCGGTHVNATGEIGLFKITGVSSISAGVKRIEAVTANEAIKRTQSQAKTLKVLAQLLGGSEDQLLERLSALQNQCKNLQKQLKQQAVKAAEVEEGMKPLNNNQVLVWQIHTDLSMSDLRQKNDLLKKKFKQQHHFVLFGVSGEKCTLLYSATPDITSRQPAADTLKKMVKALGGTGGGGRQDFAQGGVPKPENKLELIKKVEIILNSQ